jgi:hypothetical protein
MAHDLFLVSALNILVIDRIARLRVNPADMEGTILETTMLDITHHPYHLDTTLECQATLRLHLPSCARRPPWPNLTEAGNNDDLIKVNDVT